MAKVHRTELPYDPLPRSVAQDGAMPFDALGAYAWARSLPDGAPLSVEELVRQGRGMGMPRARAAVQYLRRVGLWHTVTVRTHDPESPLASVVIVPPEPWTRARAIAELDLPAGRIVDGPADLLLRGVPLARASRERPAQPDSELSDGLPADGLRPDGLVADHLRPVGPSYEQTGDNPPLTPRSAGGVAICDHRRPTRGCCTRADRRAAEAVAAAGRNAAERERTATVLAERAPFDPETARRGVALAREALTRKATAGG